MTSPPPQPDRAEAVGADWFLNPPLHFLVLPSGHNDAAFRIRLSLEGEFILAHVASLGGRGLLVEESVSALAFEMRPTSERLQPQRGIGIAIDGLETSLLGADRAFADLAGLTPLSTQMARQILQRCNVNPNLERREHTAVVLTDGARLGIELGTAVVPTYPRHPWVMAQQALSTSAAINSRGDARPSSLAMVSPASASSEPLRRLFISSIAPAMIENSWPRRISRSSPPSPGTVAAPNCTQGIIGRVSSALRRGRTHAVRAVTRSSFKGRGVPPTHAGNC